MTGMVKWIVLSVMGPCCLIYFGREKAAGPTGVVSEIMKESGGFGSRWMTNPINNIVKESCISDDWRKSILVFVYKGKVIHLCVGHTELLSY